MGSKLSDSVTVVVPSNLFGSRVLDIPTFFPALSLTPVELPPLAGGYVVFPVMVLPVNIGSSDLLVLSGPCGSDDFILLGKAPKITGCCASSPSKKKPKTVSPPSI